MKIRVNNFNNRNEIYFDGILHFRYEYKEIVLIQSWIEEKAKPKYRIEIILKSGAITEFQYESKKVWKRVLEILAA